MKNFNTDRLSLD